MEEQEDMLDVLLEEFVRWDEFLVNLPDELLAQMQIRQEVSTMKYAGTNREKSAALIGKVISDMMEHREKTLPIAKDVHTLGALLALAARAHGDQPPT